MKYSYSLLHGIVNLYWSTLFLSPRFLSVTWLILEKPMHAAAHTLYTWSKNPLWIVRSLEPCFNEPGCEFELCFQIPNPPLNHYCSSYCLRHLHFTNIALTPRTNLPGHPNLSLIELWLRISLNYPLIECQADWAELLDKTTENDFKKSSLKKACCILAVKYLIDSKTREWLRSDGLSIAIIKNTPLPPARRWALSGEKLSLAHSVSSRR